MDIMDESKSRIQLLEIDGVNYIVKSKKKKKPSPDKIFNNKLQANIVKQSEEVIALQLLYREKFCIEDKDNKKYSVELFIRGGDDASLQFTYPPLYPSDVPPTYTLIAPWVRDKKRKELSKELSNVYTEKFGECVIYVWVEKIIEVLRKEVEDLKRNPQNFEETPEVIPAQPPTPEEEKVPEVYEGKPIWDRGSCFSPYLAQVTSEDEVRKVIAKIEHSRKVSTAWRNTYAYRFTGPKDKIIEFGEDGGEPRAGGNLLRRLITYGANNVIVYISRRLGGSLLGSDRFKHLNDAADDVLLAGGYKNKPQAQKNTRGNKKDKIKEEQGEKTKHKKMSKKKK